MTGDNTAGLAGTAVRCVGLAAGQLPMRDLSLQSRVLNSPPYPGLSELRNDQTVQRRANQVVAWVLEQTEVCFLLTGGLSGVTITHLLAKLRPGLDLTPSGKLFLVSEAWLSLPSWSALRKHGASPMTASHSGPCALPGRPRRIHLYCIHLPSSGSQHRVTYGGDG